MERFSRLSLPWILGLVCPALAGAQVSSDVTLLSQQDSYGAYASCWGWTSPGGQELAILGTSTGTSIVDVTAPAAPVEVAFIPGPSSPWREMKTYDHYAYIVTEGTGGGMQIVDLAATPPALVATYSSTFDRAHTITIAGGYAYASGSRLGAVAQGIRILSLADPVNPVEVGAWTQHYAHDCLVRGDTLWAACINDDLVAVVDIANKAAPATLRTFTWPGNNAHNCDLTADGRYLLTTDEVGGGRLRVFDVSDLDAVHQVAEWTPNPAGIVHNVHIRGDLAFVAHYTEGMRVVDVSHPEYPVEVGWYDTWPGASGGFNGNWEVYPYAASGNQYLSDITGGLFVVRFAPTTGSVYGTVREWGGGGALAGAQVQVQGGAAATSSPSGFYKVFAPPGAATLVTSLFGFEPDTIAVVISVGASAVQDFELVRLPGASVGGTVRDAGTAAPLGAATVGLLGTPLGAVSDAGGAFGLGVVPHGVYPLLCERFGYVPAARSVTVSQLPVAIEIALEPAPIAADFDLGTSGWTRVAPLQQATSGLWIWADPVGSGGGAVQPEDDHSAAPGAACWVTGNAASPGAPIGEADVDNGGTVLQSGLFDLSAIANPMLSYWRWYSNDAGANPGTDTLHVDLSNDAGTTWHVVEDVLTSTPQWTRVVVPVAAIVAPTAQMRLRFVAEDLGLGSVVEAAVDDFMAWGGEPTSAAPPAAHDRLLPAAPNPFNPATWIRFELARGGHATLRVYDVRGRLVRGLWNGPRPAGPQALAWDGRDDSGGALPSGVYLVRIAARAFTASQPVTLVK